MARTKPERADPEHTDEERAYLANYDPGKFERPSVAVDVSLLSVRANELVTWLVRRKEPPQRGRWALPGGFVGMHESLDAAAARVLDDKSGVRDVYLEQLFTFGAPNRDPRTRVIGVAYYALIDVERLESLLATSSDDVCIAELRSAAGAPERAEAYREQQALRLAFDHAEQLGMALQRIRGKLSYAPIGFQLLRQQFTLRELQAVHEAVLGRPLNKDSFRRKMLASGELEATGAHQSEVDHRPAELYRFCKRSAV